MARYSKDQINIATQEYNEIYKKIHNGTLSGYCKMMMDLTTGEVWNDYESDTNWWTTYQSDDIICLSNFAGNWGMTYKETAEYLLNNNYTGEKLAYEYPMYN